MMWTAYRLICMTDIFHNDDDRGMSELNFWDDCVNDVMIVVTCAEDDDYKKLYIYVYLTSFFRLLIYNRTVLFTVKKKY
jgi:hypothetical protein